MEGVVFHVGVQTDEVPDGPGTEPELSPFSGRPVVGGGSVVNSRRGEETPFFSTLNINGCVHPVRHLSWHLGLSPLGHERDRTKFRWHTGWSLGGVG